ncbi:hypothetical protein B0J14DRAFT_432110, partial [Halenospora varia]
LFQNATSLDNTGQVVVDGLVKKLSKALSIDAENLDVTKTLQAYGVDSLLAVELRNYFAKEFSADVAVFDITGTASFNEVGALVAKKSQSRKASW